MSPLSQFSIAISIAAVIAVALYQANMQGLTVGSFAAFMAALGQIFDPMKRLTKIASSMQRMRSEEHTSELQSLMRNSYAVFCLKKKQQQVNTHKINTQTTQQQHTKRQAT